jgi:hypothetical protein
MPFRAFNPKGDGALRRRHNIREKQTRRDKKDRADTKKKKKKEKKANLPKTRSIRPNKNGRAANYLKLFIERAEETMDHGGLTQSQLERLVHDIDVANNVVLPRFSRACGRYCSCGGYYL